MSRQSKFLSDRSVDTENEIMIMLCNDAQDARPTPSQLTTALPSMHLDNYRTSRQRQRPCHLQDTTSSESLKFACQVSTRELQHGISFSPCRTELQTMGDSLTSFGSDINYEDLHGIKTMSSTGSVLDAEEEQLWCSYFKSDTLHNSHRSRKPAARPLPPRHSHDQSLSPCHRNFGLSDLTELQHSDVVRPQRSDRIHQSLSILPPTTYSLFPPPVPTPPKSAHLGPITSQHKSWPVRNRSHNRLPLRSRALTAPSQYKPSPPSNLSTCTTVFDNPEPQSTPSSTTSSSSSPLYMSYYTPTSHLRPKIDIMDLMAQHNVFDEAEAEISTFEYDDDDNMKSKGQRLAARFHLRSISGNSASNGASPTSRTKRSRRSLGQVWKGMLKTKKGGTL